MGTFVSSNNTLLYGPGILRWLWTEFKQNDWLFPKLFAVESSSKQYEKLASMFGIENVPSKTENENYAIADVANGYNKTFTHTEYGLVLKHSLVAEEDELYGFLSQFPEFLRRASIHTIETQPHAVINALDSTAGPDGDYYLSTSHPSLVGDQSNTPATQIDLGYTSLQAAKTSILNMKSHEGHPIVNNDQMNLVVSPTLWAMVEQLLKGDKQPFSANNTVNVLQGMFTPIVDPYVTDTNGWYIMRKPNKSGAIFFWRVKPSIKEYVDPNNDARAIRERFRFSNGIMDWRQSIVYGSTGTA